MSNKKLAKERKRAEDLANEMFVTNRSQRIAEEIFGTKSQRLADQMFGKDRRQSAPGAAGGTRRMGGGAPAGMTRGLSGSIASRSGVRKQTASPFANTSNNAPRGPRNPTALNRNPRGGLTRTASSSAINNNKVTSTHAQPVAQRTAAVNDDGHGLSIRGSASSSGPYVVIAQNFQTGTTSEDIQNVMAPVGGELAYCKLVANNPTVICEMAFNDRQGAQEVIDTFNGQKADGRPLYVYMKEPAAYSDTTGRNGAPKRVNDDLIPHHSTAPAAPDTFFEPDPVAANTGDEIMTMDVDGDARLAQEDFKDPRAVEDRRREDRRSGQDRGYDDRDRYERGPRQYVRGGYGANGGSNGFGGGGRPMGGRGGGGGGRGFYGGGYDRRSYGGGRGGGFGQTYRPDTDYDEGFEADDESWEDENPLCVKLRSGLKFKLKKSKPSFNQEQPQQPHQSLPTPSKTPQRQRKGLAVLHYQKPERK
ncbi:hypothetical protein MBLNU230_g2039t1 [Neophaeotheca triangularis]